MFLVNYDTTNGDILHNDHTKYIIRDSIFYRFESIIFHLILSIKEHKEIINYVNQNFSNETINDSLLIIKYKERIHFLFDDIIFGVISFFDYIGNLIGLMYMGKDKTNIKWNGIIEAARDSNNAFHTTKLAPILLSHHNCWIDHLYKYRSRLIHKQRDLAGGGITINTKEEMLEIDFVVDPPVKFIRGLKILKREFKGEITIIDVSIWLINKTIDTATEFLKVFRTEIR